MNNRAPLLRRVRLSSKMALMTVMFLSTIAALLLLLIPRSLEDRAFTRAEQHGVEFLMPLRKAMDAVQRHRGTIQIAIKGDAAAQGRLPGIRAEADAAFSSLVQLSAQKGEFKLEDRAKQLQEAWKNLAGAALDARASMEKHTQSIEDILTFYKAVADASNLTLDPELESYYLMDTLVFNTPELVEHLGRVRALAAGAVARKELSSETRIDLVVQLELMNDHKEAIADAFNKIIAANPQQEVFRARLTALQSAITQATDVVNREVLSASPISADPNRVFETITVPIARGYEIYDAALPALVASLDRRAAALDRSLLLAWLMLGLALLAAVLSVFVTRNVVKPIQVAVGISNSIADGGLENAIDSSGSDEAADLLGALARMQRDLKARIESERAIAAENLRIRNALDSASTNIMIANKDGVIVYANPAVLGMLRVAEGDIRKSLPQFSVDAIVGGSFDRYHRNPAHQQQVLSSASSRISTQIKLGGRTFSLTERRFLMRPANDWEWRLSGWTRRRNLQLRRRWPKLSRQLMREIFRAGSKRRACRAFSGKLAKALINSLNAIVAPCRKSAKCSVAWPMAI